MAKVEHAQRSKFGKKFVPNEHYECARGITCIKLTQGRWALIDTEDYDKVSSYRWYALKAKNGTTYYAATHVYSVEGRRGLLKMHRVVMDAPGGLEVDHKKWNGCDNRKQQLRIVTRRQNAQNLNKDGKSSKHPGVSLDAEKNKYKSQLDLNGKRVRLGYFDTEDEAFAAYEAYCEAIGEPVLEEKQSA